MDKTKLRELFQEIKIWRKGDQRAPHKPLLLLHALGRVANNEERLQPFKEISPKLEELLKDFGPSRKSFHPEYPFWRLQNDHIWELSNTEGLETRQGNTDVKKSELIRGKVAGGFSQEIHTFLRNNPSEIQTLATLLLEEHFPDTYGENILQEVGLDTKIDLVKRKRRDPAFRSEVLRAYEYRCAVCGGQVRLENTLLALEAAHIKWHNSNGPDSVNNGLALCSLHHRLFDRGAFTIGTDSGEILVSDLVNGGQASTYDWLFKYHCQALSRPQRVEFSPEKEFLEWHNDEVFKGEPRDRFGQVAAEPGP